MWWGTHDAGQRAVDVRGEAAGAQQRGVDEVGARGGGQHGPARAALRAVQPRQQLVHHAVRHAGRVVPAPATPDTHL